MSCPVCRHEGSRPVYRLQDRVRLVPGTFELVECRSCGVQYLEPMPDGCRPDPFYEAYWDANPDAAPSLAGRLEAAYRWLLNWSELVRLRRWLRPGARLLDAGCGGGDALSILKRWGYECHGLEASEAGVRLTRSRLGIDARQGTLEQNDLDGGTFDAVMLSHVIEHLPDPRRSLAEVRRLLRPGGLLFLMLPSIDCLQRRLLGAAWFVYHPPRHVVYYTPSALSRLLADERFVARAVHHVTLKHGPAILVNSLFPAIEPYHLRGVAGARGLARRALYLALCMAVMPFTFLEGLVRRSPTLLVVAQEGSQAS